MIKPRYMPPDSYIDDPAEKIDPVDSIEQARKEIPALASEALTRFGEWITRGEGGVTNRAFRSDIVLLSITPQYLPTNRPSAAWVGREHGVSRQRARTLWAEFKNYVGIQFRGQRTPPRRKNSIKRRSTERTNDAIAQKA